VTAPTDLWGPIAEHDWRETPCTIGRVATQDDIAMGSAVFAIESGKPHRPWALVLPRCGIEHRVDGTTAAVIVVQAEEFNDKVLFGVRYIAGGNDVCTADEVELLDDAPAGFFASATHVPGGA
jgi:hypothetical protein